MCSSITNCTLWFTTPTQFCQRNNNLFFWSKKILLIRERGLAFSKILVLCSIVLCRTHQIYNIQHHSKIDISILERESRTHQIFNIQPTPKSSFKFSHYLSTDISAPLNTTSFSNQPHNTKLNAHGLNPPLRPLKNTRMR